jgi:hypothetical protein
MDPVPDPLLLRKSGSAGNWTRNLWVSSQEVWPLDHRGGRVNKNCKTTSTWMVFITEWLVVLQERPEIILWLFLLAHTWCYFSTCPILLGDHFHSSLPVQPDHILNILILTLKMEAISTETLLSIYNTTYKVITHCKSLQKLYIYSEVYGGLVIISHDSNSIIFKSDFGLGCTVTSLYISYTCTIHPMKFSITS